MYNVVCKYAYVNNLSLQNIKDQHKECLLLKCAPMPFILRKHRCLYLEYSKQCADWEISHTGKPKVQFAQYTHICHHWHEFNEVDDYKNALNSYNYKLSYNINAVHQTIATPTNTSLLHSSKFCILYLIFFSVLMRSCLT